MMGQILLLQLIGPGNQGDLLSQSNLVTFFLGLISLLLLVIAFFLRGFVDKVKEHDKEIVALKINDKAQDIKINQALNIKPA